MTNQDPRTTRNLDGLSVGVFVLALLAVLILYFVFYASGIEQGVGSGTLPEDGILWLEIHISVYWISYSLYLTGLLLAIILFIAKATTRFPWIETATIVATVCALIGFITGVLFSKPAWNTWWIWDAKHTVVLLNTLILLGISPFVILTRSYSRPEHRNAILILLLFVAVASCAWSLLIGYVARNIHPQWFPNIFF